MFRLAPLGCQFLVACFLFLANSLSVLVDFVSFHEELYQKKKVKRKKKEEARNNAGIVGNC